MVTLKINGKEVTVKEGTLILDAAKEAGFEIPTFCYQANLSELGSCRMCLVEVEGQKKLQPSCITPVMPRMSVLTETPEVVSARRAMLEFLLSNHSMDCPICDKGGECELQDIVYKHGPRKGRHAETKLRFHEKDYVLSPVIVKNSNRCVQCMRCVRVCGEIVGRDVLGAIGRGAYQEESSFKKTTLECDHDGMCIEVCPVGCFMRRPYRYTARPWDLKSASSVCPYCGTGCRVKVEARAAVAVRARASQGEGWNGNMLCARGRFGYDIVNGERLTTPLLRTGDSFEPISWTRAFSMVREKLFRTPPDRIAAVASAALTNEELYLFQKLFRFAARTSNIDSSTRWRAAAVGSFVSAAQVAERSQSVYDCMEADAILVVGGHVSDENPVTDYILRYAAADRRKRLVVISARAMKLDSSAALSLRHWPGRAGKILSAIAGAAQSYSSESGVSADDLKEVSEVLKKSQSISILAGTDFLRHSGAGGLKILTNALRGLGKAVTVLPLLDRVNQRGAWDMGVHPFFGPGYGAVEKGLDFSDSLERASAGSLDLLYVAGEDVFLAPDTEFTKSAISKVGFIVAQDSFMTETAKLAHLVLPGALLLEKEGTVTNGEGRVQCIRALLQPPGEAKPDLEIIAAMADGLSCEPWRVFEEIKREIPLYRGIEFTGKNGEALLSGGVPFDFSYEREPELKEGQLWLATGNHLLHCGGLSRRSEILRGLLKEPVAEVSEALAATLGVADGSALKITGNGFSAVFSARVKKGAPKEVVFVPENFPELPVGRFFKKGETIAAVAVERG